MYSITWVYDFIYGLSSAVNFKVEMFYFLTGKE